MAFEQGWKGGPGRPKGSVNKYSAKALEKAFAKAAREVAVEDKVTGKKKVVKILEHLCKQAFTNNQVALQLIKFLMPTLKQVEVINKTPTEYSNKTPEEILAEMVDASAPKKED